MSRRFYCRNNNNNNNKIIIVYTDIDVETQEGAIM